MSVLAELRGRLPLLSIGRRVRFRHVEHALERLPEPRRALDAGCGDGRLARRLLERAPDAEVVAIDVEPELVEANRRTGPAGIDWRLGGVGELDLPREHFDLVVCVDVMEHIRDDEAAMRWLADRLTPGGALVIHVPGAGQRHLRSVAAELEAEISAGEGPHFREGYGPAQLRALGERAGLQPLEVASTFHVALVRWAVDVETWVYLRRARWLKALLLPLLLAVQAIERRASPTRHGNGCMMVASRPAGGP